MKKILILALTLVSVNSYAVVYLSQNDEEQKKTDEENEIKAREAQIQIICERDHNVLTLKIATIKDVEHVSAPGPGDEGFKTCVTVTRKNRFQNKLHD